MARLVDSDQSEDEDGGHTRCSKQIHTMIDDWFSTIKLPLTIEQFHQLPQNAAYKYEYFDGQAWLSPRPHSYYAILDLQTFARPVSGITTHEKVVIRPLQEPDWSQLPKLLAAAFHRVQPFASLADDTRLKAAEDCLGHTRAGGDGSFVDDACMVAARDDGPVGAILITLPPDPPMKAAVGLPHVTWVFVSPWDTRHGIGTALLDAAVQALLQRGYDRLASGFLIGNESSMLWHWQAGFRLPEQPWSRRTIQKKLATRS